MKLFRGKAKTLARPAASYTTRCLCGEPIQGSRQPEYQIVTCPNCGTSVFVLPQSPLPPPPGMKVAKSAAKPKTAASERAARPAPTPVPRRSRPSVAQRSKAWGQALAASAAKLIPPRQWFTVPKLIFMGVAFVIVVTISWQIHQRHLTHLREELIPEARRGLQALADGEFAKAHEHLGFAVNAMDTLEESVADGPKYRQAFAELDVVQDLLEYGLDDSLISGPESLSYFNSSLYEKALIFDAVVEPAEEGFVVHYVAFMKDTPVPIDGSSLDLFNEIALTKPTRVIFGARFQEIVETGDGYRLRLIPDSGALITEARIYETLGLAKDPKAGEVRLRQKELVEKFQKEAQE